MSLINQMLRDLDRRHSGGAVDRILRDVLPAEALGDERRLQHILPWVLLAVALGALALLWLDQHAHRAGGTQEIEIALPKLAATAAMPATPAMVAAQPAAPSAPAPANPAAPTPLAATASTSSPATSVAPAPTAAPAAAPPVEQHAAAREALLAAERDWRGEDSAPATNTGAVAVPPASAAAAEVESPGVMRIEPSPGPRAADNTALIQQAESQIAHGEIERGLGRLRGAVAVTPTSEALRLAYVRQLLRLGRKSEAEAELRAALAATPRAAGLAQTLAHLLFDRGDAPGALAVLLSAAPPVASAPDYHAFVAALQQRGGDHAAAIASYRGVVAATPDHGAAWIGLGISLAAIDERTAAVTAFAQARATRSLSSTMDAYAAAEIARLQAKP